MNVCMYVCMYTYKNTHTKANTYLKGAHATQHCGRGSVFVANDRVRPKVGRLFDLAMCVCVCVYVLCKTGRLRLTCVCLTHAYMHACMCEYRVRVCRTHNQGVRACDTYIHISLPDLVTALSERVMSSAESCTFARYGFRIWQNSTKVRVRSPCATAPSTSPMLTKALLTTGGSITPV